MKITDTFENGLESQGTERGMDRVSVELPKN